MGILWIVCPLSQEVREWLDKQEVTYPQADSRLPIGAEIKQAVTDLSGKYRVSYNDNGVGGPWQASFTSAEDPENGPWALLNVREYKGDQLPTEFSFESGWESLNVEIVRAISKYCGPLVLIDDVGPEPQVIAA